MPVPSLEEEVEAALAVVENPHLLLDLVPEERLAEAFRAFDVSVLVEFERKKVARRDIIPLHATVRIGSLEGLQERTLL